MSIMSMKYILFFSLLISTISFSSCGGDPEGDIQDYLDKNNLTAEKTDDGLYYIIDLPGSAKKPVSNSDVKVIYKGYLLDGTVFDESKDGAKFNLSLVIPGWTRGIPLFGEGGKGKLIIPPNLGYGDNESASIPANSVLVFDIELVQVY